MSNVLDLTMTRTFKTQIF